MGRNRKIVATELSVSSAPVEPYPFDAAVKETLAKLVVSRRLPFTCDDNNWTDLQRIFNQFYQSRSIAVRLPSQLVVDKHLAQLAKAADALSVILAQMTSPSDDSVALRKAGHDVEANLKSRWLFELKPQGERAVYEWDLEDVANLTLCLAEAAKPHRQPSEIIGLAPQDFGFVRFVSEMDVWWQDVTGRRPSARKDHDNQVHPKSSAYVEFLRAMLPLLPVALRPPVGSTPSALATAVNAARKSKSGK